MHEDLPETRYVVEWLVPAENAIGGKAYWYPFEDGRFTDRAEAVAAFLRAGEVHGRATVRLVKVTHTLECRGEDA
jgi:hypothetical protein